MICWAGLIVPRELDTWLKATSRVLLSLKVFFKDFQFEIAIFIKGYYPEVRLPTFAHHLPGDKIRMMFQFSDNHIIALLDECFTKGKCHQVEWPKWFPE